MCVGILDRACRVWPSTERRLKPSQLETNRRESRHRWHLNEHVLEEVKRFSDRGSQVEQTGKVEKAVTRRIEGLDRASDLSEDTKM